MTNHIQWRRVLFAAFHRPKAMGIDRHGFTTVVGLQRTLGHYIDSFAFGSPLEIRRDNDAFQHIADIITANTSLIEERKRA